LVSRAYLETLLRFRQEKAAELEREGSLGTESQVGY